MDGNPSTEGSLAATEPREDRSAPGPGLAAALALAIGLAVEAGAEGALQRPVTVQGSMDEEPQAA